MAKYKFVITSCLAFPHFAFVFETLVFCKVGWFVYIQNKWKFLVF